MSKREIELADKKLRLHKVPTKFKAMDDEKYESKIKELQDQLLLLQSVYFHEGRSAILVFEGWDASGKGGIIRQYAHKLDPRGFRVYPISAPTEHELARHYLYRFWNRLPGRGTTAIFDRSWYGRVLVERVEELTPKKVWKRAYDEINQFEKMLVDDGVRIVKLFIHITPEEQLERFRARLLDPTKAWKLTEEDLRNRAKWRDYEEAIEDMFDHTSTVDAPWEIVPGNDKRYARLHALNYIVKALCHGVEMKPPPIDEALVAEAMKKLGIDQKDIDEAESAQSDKKRKNSRQ